MKKSKHKPTPVEPENKGDQMTYLVSWTTKDHVKSIDKFTKHGHALPDGIKILGSWHVIGQGRGVIVVEVADQKLIHAASLDWGQTLDLRIDPVISDADAKAVLAGV